MKILVIDNYDSFTYNLVHAIRSLGYEVDVVRNDKIEPAQVEGYDKILLSPGPGIPSEAGRMPQIIQQYAPTKSILGICLGEQAIGEAFGAQLENLAEVFHGVQTPITRLEEDLLFRDIDKEFAGGRYHSWVVSEENFPQELIVTAVDGDNRIMALAHKQYDVRGVQFHPESVLTPEGMTMIKNWLEN
jgi:anthranilate synthase component 2